jgi:uncharacterized protein YaaN involved in tellurite resistance
MTQEESLAASDAIPAMSEARIKEISEQVNNLFNEGGDALNEIYTLGQGSLIASKGVTENIETKLRDVLGDNDIVTEKLNALRDAASALKVGDIGEKSLVVRGFKLLNVDIIQRKIKKVKRSYETTKEVMKAIIKELEEGQKNMVGETNNLIELNNMLKGQQDTTNAEIHALDAIIEKLEDENTDISDNRKTQLAQAARVNMMDLKLSYTANDQHIKMLSQIIHDKKLQMQAVNRASGVVMKMAVVGFIIRTALENNKRVNEVCKASQDFLSEQIVSNAKIFKEQTRQTRELSESPIVQVDKLRAAYADINDAIENAAANSKAAEINVKDAIRRIDEITSSNTRLLGTAEKTMLNL